MAVFKETAYTARQLRRNRIVVAVVTLGCVVACILGGALTAWPWQNAIGSSLLVLSFGGCFWWAFASAKAGSVTLTEAAKGRLKQTFWPN